MAPVRAPVVERSATFDTDVMALIDGFPEIEDEIEDLSELLRLGYEVPEMLVREIDSADPDEAVGLYAIRLDYRPSGIEGAGQFLVTYHSISRPMSWTVPSKTITLLTISNRRP